MSRSILILGATSSLARRISLALAKPGDRVVLAARDRAELDIIAADLRVRADAAVTALAFDAADFGAHCAFSDAVLTAVGPPDIVVIATGALGDQVAARSDPRKILDIGASNFLGAATGLAGIVDAMEARGAGHLLVLSSVAGDRGRASNYVYGAAKAGMNAYFAGLRGRLHGAGVRVTNVKLGFVDTQMVFGKPGMFLVADPDAIARRVAGLVDKPKDIVYAPWFWAFIMLIIRSIPETVFKRLPL